MDSVLESPVPVRFMFVLVGPSQSGLDFHESGRAMATLMADWVREEEEEEDGWEECGWCRKENRNTYTIYMICAGENTARIQHQIGQR